jgi:UDPglucose 6-dehydrogenase
VGADVTEVTAAMGLDARIGPRFLDAGLGWGGSCFPKDILALVTTASEYGYSPQILKAALAVNTQQRQLALDVILHYLKILRGARVGVLGIAFKPGTDDKRDSAALEVIRLLQARAATVVAHDPMIKDVADVRTVEDPYEVADGADAIVLATDWPEYLGLDLAELRRRARGDLFFDGRNMFNPEEVRAAGFHYEGIGRSSASRALAAQTWRRT